MARRPALIELVGAGPVATDTAALIYLVEQHPRYGPAVLALFGELRRRMRLVTSAITLLEVLVVPLRLGNVALARRYEQLLNASDDLSLVPISDVQLRTAAALRAEYRVKTPDALQLAAALTHGCTAFVTNDRRLRSIPGLRVVHLDDYA